jgi:peroxiredoxin
MSDRTDRAQEQRTSERDLRRFLWFAAAIVAAGALAVVLLLMIPRTNSQPSPAELPAARDVTMGASIGQRAPQFSLRTLSGDVVSLSDYRGRVVILDFWASWCVPCRATFPVLHALWQSEAERGVVLIGISLDRSRADASRYLEETGFEDTIALWGSLGDASAVADRYGVGGIPHTLVIDRSGIVQFAGHPALLGRETLRRIVD